MARRTLKLRASPANNNTMSTYASDFECDGCGAPDRDDLIAAIVAGDIAQLCRDCRDNTGSCALCRVEGPRGSEGLCADCEDEN